MSSSETKKKKVFTINKNLPSKYSLKHQQKIAFDRLKNTHGELNCCNLSDQEKMKQHVYPHNQFH